MPMQLDTNVKVWSNESRANVFNVDTPDGSFIMLYRGTCSEPPMLIVWSEATQPGQEIYVPARYHINMGVAAEDYARNIYQTYRSRLFPPIPVQLPATVEAVVK